MAQHEENKVRGILNVESLKEWTSSNNVVVIFDSDKDEFTSLSFNRKCLKRGKIAVIGITEENDVFGGYLEKAVTKTIKYLNDPNHFAFSFESHGRCETPQRWFSKYRDRNTFWWHENENVFIWFGGYGGFTLGNEKSKSFCRYLSEYYEGIENETLTGENGEWNGPFYHCKRIVVLQFFLIERF